MRLRIVLPEEIGEDLRGIAERWREAASFDPRADFGEKIMSLGERTVVARVERLTLRELRIWVREGWVRPVQGERGPVFDEIDVARLELLCDLRKDIGLPADTVPAVLALIDRLHGARRDLRRLTEAVAEQPPDVRRRIADAVRRRTEP